MNITEEQPLTAEQREQRIQAEIDRQEILREADRRMADKDAELPEPENANDMQIMQTKWVVEGWLELGVVGLLSARYAAGKSFLALDWSCCAATERDWQQRRTDKANVLYVAGEGGVAQAKRFKAWKQEHQEVDDDAIIFLRGPINVASEAGRNYLIGLIRKYDITLVVIDTLAKCAGLAEEASSTEMRPFIRACYALRDAREECGTTVLIVHHFGKDQRKGARGTSALPSDTDVNLEMYRDDEGRITLHADKLKDAETPPDLGLRLRKVHLKERWGTESSCVVESGELADIATKARSRSASYLDALSVTQGRTAAEIAELLGGGIKPDTVSKLLRDGEKSTACHRHGKRGQSDLWLRKVNSE